jgi:hypothetical protein
MKKHEQGNTLLLQDVCCAIRTKTQLWLELSVLAGRGGCNVMRGKEAKLLLPSNAERVMKQRLCT